MRVFVVFRANNWLICNVGGFSMVSMSRRRHDNDIFFPRRIFLLTREGRADNNKNIPNFSFSLVRICVPNSLKR